MSAQRISALAVALGMVLMAIVATPAIADYQNNYSFGHAGCGPAGGGYGMSSNVVPYGHGTCCNAELLLWSNYVCPCPHNVMYYGGCGFGCHHNRCGPMNRMGERMRGCLSSNASGACGLDNCGLVPGYALHGGACDGGCTTFSVGKNYQSYDGGGTRKYLPTGYEADEYPAPAMPPYDNEETRNYRGTIEEGTVHLYSEPAGDDSNEKKPNAAAEVGDAAPIPADDKPDLPPEPADLPDNAADRAEEV